MEIISKTILLIYSCKSFSFTSYICTNKTNKMKNAILISSITVCLAITSLFAHKAIQQINNSPVKQLWRGELSKSDTPFIILRSNTDNVYSSVRYTVYMDSYGFYVNDTVTVLLSK